MQIMFATRALRPIVPCAVVLRREGEVYVVCEQGEYGGEVPRTEQQQE